MTKRFKSTTAYSELNRADGTISWGRLLWAAGCADRRISSINGWFLGPKGENADLFSKLIQEAITAAVNYRRYFHPEDRPAISEEAKHSQDYLQTVGTLKYQFNILLQKLNEFTTP